MSSSKRNANKIRDAVLELTGNPFKVNDVMRQVSKSNKDFDKVLINHGSKVVKTINLDNILRGVFNVQL